MNQNKSPKRYILLFILMMMPLFILMMMPTGTIDEDHQIAYTEFWEMVNADKVETVYIDLNSDDTFIFEDVDGTMYMTDAPRYDDFKKDLLEAGVTVEEQTDSLWSSLLPLLWDIGILVLMFTLITRITKGAMNNNKAEPITPDNKATKTFKDVAGLKQVKQDMVLLVDFLKNPAKYHAAGAKMPKGVIFYGPPGTGKTLLARAIAGEAGVPFYSASGSDFVEMFVGLGAKRVRELFANARKTAPCIVFIDELDAIGGKRDVLSGNSEQRQTINALLAEMDGFSGAENILVIAATNRIEDLDAALLRPGRFDKHIAVPLPETSDERLEVIRLYTKDKKFAEDVSFDALAKETIGFSPADIQALLNEAALISVQKDKKFIDRECIDEAVFRKLLKGHAKDDSKRNQNEIKLVAWHEAGHAVLGKIAGMDVSKVTIIPSTSGAGGVNIIIPKKMGLYTIEELKAQIRMAYAGRCAEYLLFGDKERVTTGASSDIKQATELIYAMIAQYGMTEEYGMLNLTDLHVDNGKILDKAVTLAKELEDETLAILRNNREMHQEIVDILMERETISGDELTEIYNKYTGGEHAVMQD
ncbi:MAG: AAA family ATPase [Bacteroidaceae bacterium]|nr:AAA family ATPase [Bacteroidaceae bacterium]